MTMRVVLATSIEHYIITASEIVNKCGRDERRIVPLLAGMHQYPQGFFQRMGADVISAADFLAPRKLHQFESRLFADPFAVAKCFFPEHQTFDFGDGILSGDARGIVAARRDASCLIGLAFGALTNRPVGLFESLAEFRAREKSLSTVTIVTSADWLSTQTIQELSIVSASCSVGVVTGKDLSDIAFLAAKAIVGSTFPDAEDITVLYTDGGSSRPGHSILEYGDVAGREYELLCRTHKAFLGIQSHGDSIDAAVGQATLCGRVALPAVPSCRARHSCQLDADKCTRHPNGGVARIDVSHLDARMVLLDSCMTVAADGRYDRNLSLALGCVQGTAEAFLGSTRSIVGCPAILLFARAALREGLTFGAVANLVCRAQQLLQGPAWRTEPGPTFLLIGDAGGALVEPRGIEPAAIGLEIPGTITISTRNRFLELVRLETLGAPWIDPLEVAIEHAEGADDGLPLYACLLQGDGDAKTTLAVFSISELPRMKVTLRIAPASRVDASEPLAAERSVTFLRYLQDKTFRAEGLRRTPQLAVMASDLAAELNEADKVLRLMRDMTPNRVGSASVFRGGLVEADLGQIANGLVKTSMERLASKCHAWDLPHLFYPFYDGYLRHEGIEHLSQPCHICGSMTFTSHVKGTLRPDIRRELRVCPSCEILSDAPSGFPVLQLEGPDYIAAGGIGSYQLRATSPDKASSHMISSALCISRGAPWLTAEVFPESVTWRLNDRESPSFNLRVANISTPGVYFVTVASFSNYAFALTMRPIAVTE